MIYNEVLENYEVDCELESVEKEFLESLNITLDESALLEYSAKENDIEDFKEMAKQVQYWAKWYLNIIEAHAKLADQVLVKYKAVKTDDQGNKLAMYISDEFDKIKEMYNKYDESMGTLASAHRAFKAICRKFSIKYGDNAMEEKKKLGADLDKMYKELDKYWKKYFSTNRWVNQYNSICDNCPIKLAVKRNIVNEFYPFWNNLYREVVLTAGDINGATKALRLQKENGLMYKFLQKVIKSKPSKKDFK